MTWLIVGAVVLIVALVLLVSAHGRAGTGRDYLEP